MQIRVEDIKVRKRIRRDLGDVNPLMESMKKYGLLCPLIVNKSYELIAGRRRLEAARLLGWQTVSVTVLDKDDDIEKLEMEIDENTLRKDFTTDELADGYATLDKVRNPSFFKRIWLAIKRFFSRLFRRKIKNRQA
ncbi:MAG: ParB N-terminal domain-containing protein [Spirochaetales bacterium]|jgi:ParB family chromosome partitioning protein|nr:ParB N-terminal domain-containing protein [Spirochaetales bacterium]